MLDLDDFKAVNDSFGHEVGDELLKQAAGRLLGLVRDADTVARLGGDEFVIVLEGASSEQAQVIVERTKEAFAQVFELAGHRLQIRPSIGLACSQPPHDQIETLLRQADMAMYRAKGVGKRRLRVDDSEQEQDEDGLAAAHQSVKSEIESALESLSEASREG